MGANPVITTPTVNTPLTIGGSYVVKKLTDNAGFGRRTGAAMTVFLGKLWIVGGNTPDAASTADVFNSDDSISWTLQTSTPGFDPRLGATLLVYHEEMYLIGGGIADVWKTADGITWTLVSTSPPAFGERSWHCSLVFNDLMWVIAGSVNSTEETDVYSSADGDTWTQTAANAFNPGIAWAAAVVFDEAMIVFGGSQPSVMYGGGDPTGVASPTAYYSSNGTSWFDYSSIAIAGHTVVNLDGTLVAVGGVGADQDNGISTSVDGESWTKLDISLVDLGKRVFHSATIYKGRIVVAGGLYAGIGGPFLRDVFALQPDSLALTEASRRYTHYSLYRNKDMGATGTDPTTGLGNNPELFVWAADIPIIKTLSVTGTLAAATIAASRGAFSSYDAGTDIFIYDATKRLKYSNRRILTVVSSSEATLDTAINVTDSPAVIGSNLFFKASQSAHVVTVDSMTGFSAKSTDVGSLVFWDDGTTSLITGYTSALIFTAADSTTRTSMIAGIVRSQDDDSFACYRGFSDIATDDDLTNRTATYALKNRFWTALPDCNTGAFAPGWLVAAIRGTRRVEYQQMADPRLIGYHNDYLQYDYLDDAITEIRNYLSVVCAICARSTVSYDPTQIAYSESPEVGEAVATLAQKRVVDSVIGCIAWGGITEAGNGLDIMLTSDHEIRTFDGLKYSANLAEQRCMKLLRLLQPLVSSSYDQIGGYLLWGTETELTVISGVGTFATFDKCYRFALTAEQGTPGGVRVTGADWIVPPECVGGQRITDEYNNTRQVIFDNTEGKCYEISTKDGPEGSGLTRTELDKDDGNGNGTEITSEVWFKADKGPTLQEFLRHVLTKFCFMAYKQANRSATGYDSDGFRNGTAVTVYFYKDGNTVSYYNLTENIPKSGDVVIQGGPADECRTIQVRITISKSGWKLIGSLHQYMAKDKAADPSLRLMSEGTYQLDIANVNYWYSRGSNLYLERVSQVTASGTPVPSTGPDAKANSSFVLYATKTFAAVPAGTSMIMLWMYEVGQSRPNVVGIGGVDITNSLTQYGATHASFRLWYLTGTFSGALIITPHQGVKVFDIRCYATALSAAELAYYYDQIVSNGGSNVCPRW